MIEDLISVGLLGARVVRLDPVLDADGLAGTRVVARAAADHSPGWLTRVGVARAPDAVRTL